MGVRLAQRQGLAAGVCATPTAAAVVAAISTVDVTGNEGGFLMYRACLIAGDPGYAVVDEEQMERGPYAHCATEERAAHLANALNLVEVLSPSLNHRLPLTCRAHWEGNTLVFDHKR